MKYLGVCNAVLDITNRASFNLFLKKGLKLMTVRSNMSWNPQVLRWRILSCSSCMLISRYASTKHPITTVVPFPQ